MKLKVLTILGFLALILTVACSSGASGDANVSTTFKVDSVVSSGSTNNIEADMLDPEGITADYATITVSNFTKNPNATPSHLNNVTIYKYEVSFRRSDGGTVFETFEKNLTQTVQVNSTEAFSALIVRLEEKTSGALAGQVLPIQMEADIKVYGRTGSGDEVTATGGIAVTIADYNGETPPAAEIGAFFATKSQIDPGDTVSLAWHLSGSVYDIVINPGNIHLDVNNYYPYGTIDIPNVTPPQTFTLQALGLYGSAVATTEVTLKEGGAGPTINYFGGSPDTIVSGSSSTLQWDVTGADSINIYPGVGSVALGTGTVVVSPSIDTTYSIVATNSGGTSTETFDISVTSSDPEIGLFTASASEVSYNDVVHLYWNVYGNYTKLELFPYYDGANDILDVTNYDGSVVSKAITHDTTFVLSAFGPNKIVNASVDVTVATTKQAAPTIKSHSLIDSKLSLDVENISNSKVKYNMFTSFGDQLRISNPTGYLTDTGKISTNIQFAENKFGYSVLATVFEDNNGKVNTDYRFVSESQNNGLIENVLVNSDEITLELFNKSKVFIKQISGKDSIYLKINGEIHNASKAIELSSDIYMNFKVNAETGGKLLIVAKNANGVVNGRILTIGQ